MLSNEIGQPMALTWWILTFAYLFRGWDVVRSPKDIHRACAP